MKSSLRWFFAVALLSGCVATDVGNPQDDPATTTETEVDFEAFEEELVNALMLDDGVELTEAWIVTDRVRLKPCEAESEMDAEAESDADSESDSSDDGSVAEMVIATDLLTGTSYPSSPLLTLQSADFCGFELRPAATSVDELPAGAPDALADAAMVVRGKRKDGVEFEVRSTLGESFELDGEIHLDAGRRNRLVVGFAVNGWVTQQDLAPLDGDPIEISDEVNSAIHDAFEDKVSQSVRLFLESTSRRPIAE